MKNPFIIEVSFFMDGPPTAPKYLAESGKFRPTKKGAQRFSTRKEAQAEADNLNAEECDIEHRVFEVRDTREVTSKL